MKTLTIFLWLAIGKSEGAFETKEKSPIRTAAIVGLADRSAGEFTEFNGILNERLQKRCKNGEFQIGPGTFEDTVTEVYNDLETLSKVFMSVSYTYVARKMFEYFYTAQWLIASTTYYFAPWDGLDAKNVTSRTNFHNGIMRKQIGFEDDYLHRHCMLTAFYDCGVPRPDVDLLLDSTLFAQTDLPSGQFRKDQLLEQLIPHKKAFETYLRLPRNEYLQPPSNMDLAIDSMSGLLERIGEVKQVINDFSNMFCPWWRPYVSGVGRERRHKSPFMRHVLENEECEIARMTKSGEYGYEKYAGIVKKLFKFKSSSSLTPSNLDPEWQPYSLARFKKEYSTRECENSMTYYRIAVDVLVLVSIKEGLKVLKGIKHEAQRVCGDKIEENVERTADEMRGLRSTLFAFKSVFDRLLVQIREKHQMIVEKNSHKTTFDDQIRYVMKEFNKIPAGKSAAADNRMSIRNICDGIRYKLHDPKFDATLVKDAYERVKFYDYYLTRPILDVEQLVHFIDNDFL